MWISNWKSLPHWKRVVLAAGWVCVLLVSLGWVVSIARAAILHVRFGSTGYRIGIESSAIRWGSYSNLQDIGSEIRIENHILNEFARNYTLFPSFRKYTYAKNGARIVHVTIPFWGIILPLGLGLFALMMANKFKHDRACDLPK
jgi:hypothetical protein